MKYFIIIAISLGMLSACNNNRTSTNERTEFTSTDIETINDREDDNRIDIDSLGYYGVFKGMMPAVNSRTVKAKMTLYDNNRYTIHSVDIDDNTRTEEEHGTFLIFGDLLTLTPDNGDKHYYKTVENDIVRVDENKEEIPGIHAQNFRLYRSQD